MHERTSENTGPLDKDKLKPALACLSAASTCALIRLGGETSSAAAEAAMSKAGRAASEAFRLLTLALASCANIHDKHELVGSCRVTHISVMEMQYHVMYPA